MGLFDRFRKKQEEPVKEEREPMVHSKLLADGVSEVTISNLTRMGQLKHRDNSQTELVLARISKARQGDTVMWDDTDYIAFEMPVGRKVTEAMLDEAINQYDINKRIASQGERAFYIGRMQEAIGKVIFGNKSNTVQNMVSQKVASLIQERSQQMRDSYERGEMLRQEEQRKARERDEAMRREHEAFRNRERAKRLASPELKALGSYGSSGKQYNDYDGTDVVTGDFLRLRQVDKVCKDADGTYLYSAYVDRTSNEHNAEFFGQTEPSGSFVCFTLPGRLEDIVKSGDRAKVTQVLQLLSDPRNFENEGHLSYIGGITRAGQISRSSMAPSIPLDNRIKQMQSSYEMRKQQQISSNRRSYDDDAR